MTLLQQLRQVEEHGIHDERLDLVELPPVAETVVEWFEDLNSSRQSGMGIMPLSYSEILAWSSLTGIRPRPWELRLIREMDGAYLAEHARQRELHK